jgi:hypothetical protein
MTGTDLARPGDTMADKLAYARALAVSGLLPDAYRNQPQNVLWAIEYGQMLGLPSMAAITGVHVIKGKPTASAGLISALVRRAGHKLRVTGDAQSATCQITRSDDPGFTFEVTWTLDMAVQAGLCEIKNGKPYARSSKNERLPWETYPASMLKSRAITQCARDACEEALFGLHYTPEEAGAEVDGDGNVVGGTVEPSLPTYSAPVAPAGPGEVVDAEVVEEGAAVDAVAAQVAAQDRHDQLAAAVRNGHRPDAAPEDRPGSISPGQNRMLQALMAKAFTKDERDERIAAIERLIGRSLDGPPEDRRTTANLSFTEAHDLIARVKPVTSRADLIALLAEVAA